jgi:hypothetical protein
MLESGTGRLMAVQSFADFVAPKGQIIPAQGNALGTDGDVDCSPEGAIQGDAERAILNRPFRAYGPRAG